MKSTAQPAFDYRVVDLVFFELSKSIDDLQVYQRTLSTEDIHHLEKNIATLKALTRRRKLALFLQKLYRSF